MDEARLRSVLLAGLAAGVILNVGGMAAALLIGLGDSFTRAGASPQLGGALLHTGLRFGIGLAVAYLYAIAGRRLGEGLSAVGKLVLPVWLIGYLPPVALLHEIGFLSRNQAVLSAAWGLVEASAAISMAVLVYNRLSAK
ncbi:MAG TPA: hypothetical protein VLU25_21940 [Acidobacteriota bacterium]|nr:hypothetical protein [Acidobacteriota bacterium]